MEKTTFKVELEVEVEYDIPEGMATTPYTKVGAYINAYGQVVLYTNQGNIKNAQVSKLERKE